MGKDADHFLMCFLAMCTSTLVKYLLMCFANYLIRLFVILLLGFESSSHVPGASPFVEHVVCKYYLSACILSFDLLNKILRNTKVFNTD